MPKKAMTTAGVLVSALALSLSTAGSAHAADGFTVVRGCGTTGAYGDMSATNWHGPDATIPIKFTLTDTVGDGNSVRIRLVSKDVWGKIHYWPWRTNSQGQGRTTTWNTTASHQNGLFDIGIQVARVNSDGSTKNHCTDW
ncbi:hypothetical protein [Streptomyces sp. NPDC088707]|uniref:hypothetical protein n=1 Tax=Streptomyces sp. NPDC088707 TaxID=3365871 RepID=UPI003825502C